MAIVLGFICFILFLAFVRFLFVFKYYFRNIRTLLVTGGPILRVFRSAIAKGLEL